MDRDTIDIRFRHAMQGKNIHSEGYFPTQLAVYILQAARWCNVDVYIRPAERGYIELLTSEDDAEVFDTMLALVHKLTGGA